MNSFLINPYDSIGKLHNDGLDYVVTNLSTSTVPLIDDVIRLAAEFGCRQLRADHSYSISELYEMRKIASMAIINLNDIKTLYTEANLNQQQIVLLEKLLCINPYIKIDGQEERYKQLEAEVFAYPISFKEKEPLLMASAVGKYSGKYWNTAYSDVSSPWQHWFPRIDDPRTPLGRKKWADEDAKGAVVTFLSTVLIGGVVTIVTVTVGSIAASVASLLFD